MAQGRRTKPLPGNPFDRGEQVQFNFEGRPVDGYDNEPVAVALLAAGVRVFGRSLKYHRPRGPVCMHGHCSGCLMRVNGVPNVRTCETPCRSGMVVERQTGWPSASLDLFRAVDLLSGQRLDHHGMFTASSVLNRIAGGVVRKLSGLGEPPTADPKKPVPVSRFKSDAVVIGAGVAGLAAAKALGECGHNVVLFEAEEHRGGRLLDGATQNGWERVREGKAGLESVSGIEVHVKTPALAIYPGESLEVVASNEGKTFCISAGRLVICTGAYEQIPLFGNNDLPGIFGPRAMDRLVSGHGVVPGEPMMVVGDRESTLRLAVLLRDQNVKLAGVVTSCSDSPALEDLKRKNVQIIRDRRIVQALGGRWLDRVELAPYDREQPDLVLDCRACVVEAPEAPAYELAHHAGCRVSFSSKSGYVIYTNPSGQTTNSHIFSAGHAAGATSLDQAARSGERAGLACALSLKDEAKVRERLESLQEG
jgi:sarcosine oxidase subunit alpha